jgi:hypothetical protein
LLNLSGKGDIAKSLSRLGNVESVRPEVERTRIACIPEHAYQETQCAGVTNVAVASGSLKMTRMRACNLVRCAIAPHRQVQPVLLARGLGPVRIGSGIHRMCVRSGGACTLRPGVRAATIRCDRGFRTVSSDRAAGQADQVPHTEAFADFAQLRAAGCNETAQQPISAQLLQPVVPALGAPSQPLGDPRELRRDRRLSPANVPTRVFSYFDVIGYGTGFRVRR